VKLSNPCGKDYRRGRIIIDNYRQRSVYLRMLPSMTPAPTRPYRVGYLVLPRFSMIALSCAMEPLREANWVSGQPLYEWVMMTPDGPQVTSSNETCLTITNNLGSIALCDMLIVCASFDLEKQSTPKTLSALRNAARHGTVLGSIDTGSYLLARAGLLDDYRATIHWENAASFGERFPQTTLTGEIFTIDRNRWTCSGGSAGIDMMLYLIGQQYGAELAAGVAECAIIGGIRPGDSDQRLSTRTRLNKSNPTLIAAIQVMEVNLAIRLSVPEIAAQTGVSQRQLERVFRDFMGQSPGAFYYRLRLDRARQLLRQTSLKVATISASCGFPSPEHFSRAYREMFHLPPSKDRDYR